MSWANFWSQYLTVMSPLLVHRYIIGLTPSSEKLASLTDFAKVQYSSYKAAGVARAEIGPFEALGRGYAETDQFNTKFGASSGGEFVSKAYGEVFERAATDAQHTHFQGQIAYFENLYKAAGLAAGASAQLAKGAVIGQMLGYAALDEPDEHVYVQDAANIVALGQPQTAAAESISIAPQTYDFL